LLPEFSSWPLSLQEIVKETTPVLDHNYQPNTLADGFFSIINFCIKEIFLCWFFNFTATFYLYREERKMGLFMNQINLIVHLNQLTLFNI